MGIFLASYCSLNYVFCASQTMFFWLLVRKMFLGMMRVHFFTNLLVSQMQQEAFLSSSWFHPPTLFWLKKNGNYPKFTLTLSPVDKAALVPGASYSVVWQAGLHWSWGGELPGLGRTPWIVWASTYRNNPVLACVYTSSGCVWVCTYEIGGYMHVQVCGILRKSLSRNLCDTS